MSESAGQVLAVNISEKRGIKKHNVNEVFIRSGPMAGRKRQRRNCAWLISTFTDNGI